MLNPSPDTGIDTVFDSTPRVDVLITTNAEPPLLSAITLPLPTISIILHVQQTPAPSPKIIKEQVKVQVSNILPKIKKIVNEQLKAEVLTRSSNSPKTSYAVAADLSELELKKILIENMESNKSIYRSDEQKNLYKALVDAYECDKLILDTYRDKFTLKRCQDDKDKDEEPSAGSNQSPREDEKEKKQSQLVHQRKRNPRHLGRRVIPFDHFINKDLEYLRGGASSQKYTTSVTKTKAADYRHIKWIKDLSIGILLEMSTPNADSSLSQSFKSSNGITTSILIGSLSDLKCKEAYTTYSNPKGFIYQNKDKQNILMRIYELHKFSDGTLNDVRTALDDRLKGIQIQYPTETIWRRSDKDRAVTMIHTIDKQLKTKRIMHSLEKFVGGRLKTSLVKMGVIMELHKGECCWPDTIGVVEESEGDDEEGNEEGRNEGVGGFAYIYCNMSQGDWQVRQAHCMDQQDEHWGRIDTWMRKHDKRAHWMYDHTVL
uniref:Uncharacterized protein n=1 Tax=Tanacetum cinerariifolium TaxID=118510 RepID=A0A699I2U6_TANCI|nr:hypothetical protein [Tanacetum cinerariifolium]